MLFLFTLYFVCARLIVWVIHVLVWVNRVSYRIGKTSAGLRDSNRRKIFKAIEENEEMTFKELLALGIVSREPLNRHLKYLRDTYQIERHLSKTKNRVVYRLTERSQIALTVEGMINYLGTVAAHNIFEKVLKINREFKIETEIAHYVNGFTTKSDIPPEKYYEYLQAQRPVKTYV